MNFTKHLDEILKVIDSINKKDNLYSRIKNAYRIYYLGLDQVFIADRILKNINYSGINLSSFEINHIENAGWVLDQNYLDDVYLSSLKTDFLFRIWYVLESFGGVEYNELKKTLKILVLSSGNGFKLTEDFKYEDIRKKRGEYIDFLTPDFILNVAKEFVK